MKFFLKGCLSVFFISAAAFAQFDVEDFKWPTPDFNASLGIGFNYDYLKSPLDVDFENAKGYYSVNIPIKFQFSQDLVDDILKGISLNLDSDDEKFMPNMAARQFANTTIKVDVPMLFGVCSFSHINVMSLKYENSVGMPSFRNAPETDGGISMLLLGKLNVPIDFSLGWETMTFGYVYKFNELFTVGLNLHRHRFHFNANAHIDMDIYGEVGAEVQGTSASLPINYSLKNSLVGEYTLERWTPTFAARFWNFDLIARIMFKDEAKGALSGKYSVPFFVNPSTFDFDADFNDMDYIMENIKNGSFMENKTQLVDLNTNKNMKWQLPHVLTIKYNLVPEHLSLSYSKFIGKTYIGLVDPDVGKYTNESGNENLVDFLKNGLDLRIGLNLDHLIMINGKFGWFYGNLGIIAFDVDVLDNKYVLVNADEDAAFKDVIVSYGKGAMLPVLSGGGIIGTKVQIMLELDILPLPALKTGLVYNF